MAKKRLNKKIAIIGSVVLGLLIVAAICLILYKSQGPGKFIQDGNEAFVAKDYKLAIKKYGKALALAKKNDAKIPILFKLAEVHQANNDWPKVLACWRRIMTTDTSNIPARVNYLDFIYESANQGQSGLWKEVLPTAEELIKLQSDSAKNYRIKGRSLIEMVRRGDAPDREQAIKDAVAVLEHAKKLEPANVDTYWYIAQACIQRGELMASKGIVTEKDKGYQQAQAYMKQAVAASPKDPNGYIYLLGIQAKALVDKKKPADSLEADYIALTKKFSNSAVVYAALSNFYRVEPDKIDKALVASRKANELDKTNIDYALGTASLYSFKSAISGDAKLKDAAIKMANYALELPGSRVLPGPREWTAKSNRLSINAFLVNTYIDMIMDLSAGADKAKKRPVPCCR